MSATDRPTRFAADVGCSPRCRASANIVLAVRTASSKSPPGDLGAEPDLECRGQELERPQISGSTRSAPSVWTRSSTCQSAVSSRAAQSACVSACPPYPLEFVGRQLAERHRLVAGSLGDSFLAEEEIPLLHEAAEIPLDGVAGLQLPHFRQELVLQGRLRCRHRPHGQTDRGFPGPRLRGGDGQRHSGEKDGIIAVRLSLLCAPNGAC